MAPMPDDSVIDTDDVHDTKLKAPARAPSVPFSPKNETKPAPLASYKGKAPPPLAEWVASALKGEETSYQILFHHFKGKVFQICLSFTDGDRDMAQDLCQDAFILGFKQLRSLREPSKFPVWLGQITYNRCKSYLRERARLAARLSEYERMTKREGPKETIRREQIDRIIHALIDKITNPGIRETVTLFYVQGKSTKEIAEIQKIPQSTVTTRLDRFRTKIQRQLMLKIMELRD